MGRLSMVFALLCWASRALCADESESPPSARGITSIVFENDLFANFDHHYTNGVRFSYLSPLGEVPKVVGTSLEAVPGVEEDTTRHVEYAIGQNIYTPSDITRDPPDPNDRPYAGWLYVSIGAIAVRDDQYDQGYLSIGVVGPAARAEQVQTFVHEVVHSDLPKGWSSQLSNEPGVVLGYQRTWRKCRECRLGRFEVEVQPHLGGALGNVYTYLNTGATVRIGLRMPDDYGVPRIEPSLPGSGYFKQKNGSGAYVFAGVSGRAVGRNIFLDGNTFSDSPSVDKRVLVADLQFGIVWAWRQLRIAYTHILRSPEFDGQPEGDKFGALTLSYQH